MRAVLFLSLLIALALVYLGWGTGFQPGFLLNRRLIRLGAMCVAGSGIAISAILFQSLTQNRILTPAIMGYEAVYLLLQSLLILWLGSASLHMLGEIGNMALSIAVMLGWSFGLQMTLFQGGQNNVHRLLLVGLVLTLIIASVTQFIELRISPGEFAIYQSFAVLYFEVDYRDSSKGHLAAVRDHFETLGKVFDKEDVARAGIEELDGQVSALNAQMSGCSDKALILLHNNGAFSSFGQQSRYGFVFNELGVKPAGAIGETGLHGQPVTSEFIQKSTPDLIFVIDRTAVMEGRPTLTRDQIANPLLEATKAWQDDRVIFVDPEAWYTTAAGPTSLSIMMKEIGAAYDHVGACSQTDGNAKF